MRKEEKILKSLTKTGAEYVKTINKDGDKIVVCQIKTRIHCPYTPWSYPVSIEEILTYKSGLLQSFERLISEKEGKFTTEVRITHDYKPTDVAGYDVEETITTEDFSLPKPTRTTQTRFRGRGSGSWKTIKGCGTTYNETISKTYFGNEDELLPITDPKLNKEVNNDYYDRVVFTTSVGIHTTNNNIRVSTPSGIGEYTKHQIRSEAPAGVSAIKDAFEMRRWTVRHPIYPELPVCKFCDNRVTIFDYEWKHTKYGNAKFIHTRNFTNDLDDILKYSAVTDALKGEYEPPEEEIQYPQTFARTPYCENVEVKITEGEYAGSSFSFYIREAKYKTDVDMTLFYAGFKPEDETDGFVVILLNQYIKLTMDGNTPNSKRIIELKSADKINDPKKSFIVRITENVNSAIANFISNYEIDTSRITAAKTSKFVKDDGTIVIDETEYISPELIGPDAPIKFLFQSE